MTKAKFMAEAAKQGFKVIDDWILDGRIIIEAPDGYVFAGYDFHWREIADSPPGAWLKSDAYADLFQDMEHGIEKCHIPNCEYCNDIQPLPKG